MRKIIQFTILTICVFFGMTNTSWAQLVVDGTLTPEELVEDILLGEGVVATNITFTGEDSQRGYFDGTGSNIGMDEGVILSSGDINIAVGPNNAGGSGSSVGGSGDDDLADLSGVGTFDAVILEFDFVPTGDSLKFDYIFGSEEYNEYTCGGVNDVFGFFLSGPGINGPFTDNAENIALIPGTNTPVSINTVNIGVAGTNGNAANCDAIDPDWPNYNIYFVDNPAGTSVQYDGFTVRLTAEAEVQCGETYHIKMALSDGGDGVFDSGVFLEASSFESRGVDLQFAASSTTGTALINDTTIVEGCTELSITLEREESDSLLVTYLDISGSATQGVDYIGLEDSVVFEIGVDSITITIDPIADGVQEGEETLTIGLTSFDACGNETTVEQTFLIVEEGNYDYDLNIVAEGIIECPGDSIVLTAYPDGGVPDFEWFWGNGLQQDEITIFPVGDTTLIVHAIDFCNTQSATDTLVLDIQYPGLPTVQTSNPPTLDCPGDEATLTAVGDGFGTIEYSWSSGESTSSITVVPSSSQEYTITVTDDCDATASATIPVEVIPYNAMILSTPDQSVLCSGDATPLAAIVSEGRQPYNILWENGLTGDTVYHSFSESGSMEVVVTDACDNEMTGEVNVTVPVYDLQITAIEDTTICELGEIFMYASANGGAGEYTYEWMGQDIVAGSDNDTMQVSTPLTIDNPADSVMYNYTVKATDQCDNENEHVVELWIRDCELIAPNIFTPNGDNVNDFFIVANVDYYPNSKLTVYNRWGICVYENENYQNDWNGESLESGVYYFMFFPSDQDIEPITDFVHLMRANN